MKKTHTCIKYQYQEEAREGLFDVDTNACDDEPQRGTIIPHALHSAATAHFHFLALLPTYLLLH